VAHDMSRMINMSFSMPLHGNVLFECADFIVADRIIWETLELFYFNNTVLRM